jgi:hypothetical protein
MKEELQSLYEDLGVISYNITIYENALEALHEQKQQLLNAIAEKLQSSEIKPEEDGRD